MATKRNNTMLALQARDPVVSRTFRLHILPTDLPMVRLENSIDDVTIDSDLLIVVTHWPDFQVLSSEELINNMRAPVVIDQGAFLAHGLSGNSRIQYITFGKG